MSPHTIIIIIVVIIVVVVAVIVVAIVVVLVRALICARPSPAFVAIASAVVVSVHSSRLPGSSTVVLQLPPRCDGRAVKAVSMPWHTGGILSQ